MSVLSRTWDWLTEPAFQTRSLDSFTDHPGLTEQIMAVQGLSPKPWRVASIRDALGVPAIQRCVSLIANTVGSLSVVGYHNGAEMPETPKIIRRPDPFQTPREFYRDSAYYLATRGEAVWWIAALDSDRLPASLVVVPLQELTIEANPNPRERVFPIYRWGHIESTRYSPVANQVGQFVHVTYLREPGTLRGVGPLQLCGAAVSVAVEAQDWAANYFAGSTPAYELHSLVDINEQEAKDLKAQWMEDAANNMPRVTNPTLELKAFGTDPAKAQLTDSRQYNNADAARMFGVPASLLEANIAGSSLTYTNVEGEFTKFVRACLTINYLEPIEQALTDLMPRTTVARFNVDGLLRADIKTRYEVYTAGIAAGVLDAPEARKFEGLEPGDIELAPVPFSPPAAVPASLPQSRAEDSEMRQMVEAVRELAVRQQPAPVVYNSPPSITVEGPTYEQGAFQFSAPPTEVNVTTPDVHVDVAAPDFSGLSETFAGLPAPSVTITAPDITVQPAQVTVNVPEQRSTTKTLKRNSKGDITQIIEE